MSEIEELLSTLHAVRKSVFATIDDLSDNDLLQLAADVHGCKKFISEFFSEIEEAVVQRVPFLTEPTAVFGGTVEIKRGTPRKSWDHDALISLVSKRVVDRSVDLDTGEVSGSPRDMIELALKCAGVSYWKVGALKDLHIDPSEFCTVSEPTSNLVIRRNS